MARIAILMPKANFEMEFGIVQGWLRQVGDHVAEGESIAEIETEKTSLELPSPASGTLVEITHAAGDEVPVEQPIGWLETA